MPAQVPGGAWSTGGAVEPLILPALQHGEPGEPGKAPGASCCCFPMAAEAPGLQKPSLGCAEGAAGSPRAPLLFGSSNCSMSLLGKRRIILNVCVCVRARACVRARLRLASKSCCSMNVSKYSMDLFSKPLELVQGELRVSSRHLQIPFQTLGRRWCSGVGVMEIMISVGSGWAVPTHRVAPLQFAMCRGWQQPDPPLLLGHPPTLWLQPFL